MFRFLLVVYLHYPKYYYYYYYYSIHFPQTVNQQSHVCSIIRKPR